MQFSYDPWNENEYLIFMEKNYWRNKIFKMMLQTESFNK